MEIHRAGLQSFGALFRRRIRFFFIPFLGVMLITIMGALMLPASYESSATVLIEEGDISEEIVETRFTSFVNQRIDELTQFIMSRKTLRAIIERNNLYPAMREESTMEEVVERMRKDIRIETQSTDVIRERMGRPVQATLAFTIIYANEDPRLACQVTNELASLYVDQNSSMVERRLVDTTIYLAKKKERYENEIAMLEQRIAEFKRLHVNEMPDRMEANLQALRNLEAEIDSLNAEIFNSKRKRSEIQGILRKTKPHAHRIDATGERVVDTEDRLEALRLELISKRVAMSETHPDIISLTKEIDELERVVSRKQRLMNTQKKLTMLEAQNAEMSGRMTPQHPDRARVLRELDQVRHEFETLSAEIDSQQEVVVREPDNPAYIDLETQLKILELNMQEAASKLSRMKQRKKACAEWIQATPGIEKAYRELTRNYDNLRDEYQEILHNISDATEARGIEEERMGQRFNILDEANVPEEPSEPDVLMLTSLGFLLSLCVGLGSVYVAEFYDSSVRTAEELQAATGLPVLSTIPYIVNEEAKRARRWKRVVFAVSVGILLSMLLGYMYIYIY